MFKTRNDRMLKRKVLRALLGIGLLGVAPLTSFAGGIGFTGPFLTCSISYNRTSGWSFSIDPQNVESFQLDVRFDPTRALFSGLDYVSPYNQTQGSSPDFSQLGSGLLQDVAGTSSVSPPPSGDVDLFTVRFSDLNPSLSPALAPFTVFASSNDFIVGVDPSTGQATRYSGSGAIPSETCVVPEANTGLLIGSCGLGVLAYYRRKKMKRGRQAETKLFA
jgi:hypothetical protein